MARNKQCPHCFKAFYRDRPNCSCERRIKRLEWLAQLAKQKRNFNMKSISKDDSDKGAKKIDKDARYF